MRLTLGPDSLLARIVIAISVAGCLSSVTPTRAAASDARSRPRASPERHVGVHAKFAYVGSYASTILGFAVDSSTGALTPLPGSPFATSSYEVDLMVAHPSGRYIYALGSDSNGAAKVYAFRVDESTGSLTEITGSPVLATAIFGAIAVDPDGKYLYAAASSDLGLFVYAIDPSTGALSPEPGLPGSIGYFIGALASDPAAPFVYLIDYGGFLVSPGDIAGYQIDFSTGAAALIPGSTFTENAGAGGTVDMVIDPAGRFAYTLNELSSPGVVNVYRIQSSGLLTTTGASAATGKGASSIAMDPSGRFAFVANQASDSVSAYAVDRATGTLQEVRGSPFSVAGNASTPYPLPLQVRVDPSGHFVFVVCQSQPGLAGVSYMSGVAAFRIDRSTGALTPAGGIVPTVPSEPTGSAAIAIVGGR